MADNNMFIFDEKKINEIKKAGSEVQETEIKEIVEHLTSISETIDSEKDVPLGYIPIDLPSSGKFGYPKRVHFRNFGMDELVDLSTIAQNGYTELLVKCLNRMIHEPFDLTLFHEKDLEVIMVSLYANFQGKVITDKPYYLDNTLEGEELDTIKNIGYTNILISNLKINPIKEEFAEPFEIRNEKGDSVSFVLPRIKHILITEKFINEKYADADRKFFRIKQALEKNENTFEREKIIPIDIIELSEYEEHLRQKTLAYVRVLQGQLLHSLGKKKLDTMDEKLSASKKVDPKFWAKYNKTVANLTFGIDNNYTFFSKEVGKEITRRFLFQPMDFIPTVEQEDDSNYTVHFGVSLS